MWTRYKLILFVTICFLVKSQALGAIKKINWQGFGSINSSFADHDAGYIYGEIDESVSFNSGSLLGLNGSTTLNNQWTAIFQIIARGESDDFNQSLDWAQLNWDLNDNLQFRFGRQKYPIWMISDHYDVGMLYPWVRPPEEVYYLIPIVNFNGVAMNYKFLIDRSRINLDIYGGNAKIEPGHLIGYNQSEGGLNLKGEFEDLVGASLSYKSDHLTLRASYSSANVNFKILDLNLLCGDPSDGCTTEALAGLADVNMGRSYFVSTGLKVDFLNVFLIAEAAKEKTHSDKFNEAKAAYITLGYHINKLSPFVTWAAVENPDGTQSILPGDQESYALGINYQISDALLMKSQWKNIDVDPKNGLAENTLGVGGPQGRFSQDPEERVNIYTLGLSFVF